MSNSKREILMKKVEHHLRTTSRQLIKINTEDEVLQYLADSFRSELYCDFVGVVLSEGDSFIPKAWSGNIPSVLKHFPLLAASCSSKLLRQSLTYKASATNDSCRLTEILKEENVKTWFTVPLNDDIQHFGFCIVGFLSYVPLLELESHFEEFGKDMAVALSVARQKENQLKKLEGIEWISKNQSLDSSLDQHFLEVTHRAGNSTNADFACMYLYNEKENCFDLQKPVYGEMEYPDIMMIEDNYALKEYFPFLEEIGCAQMTVPLLIDLKPIGVLHVQNKYERPFSEEDLKILEMLSTHVATLLENARLYKSEKDNKNRLHFLLDFQQSLVKKTVEDDDFEGITLKLSDLFQETVILYDRFMRPIAFNFRNCDNDYNLPDNLALQAKRLRQNLKKQEKFTVVHPERDDCVFSFWVINGGGNLLGYLAVCNTASEMNEFDQLTVEMARNICSIQFIKQKLVLDTKEQVKDSFISKLLVGKIEDQESIIQYANLFQWDIFKCHRVAVLTISLNEDDLLEQQAKKVLVWDAIKSHLAKFDSRILTVSHDENYILLIPVDDDVQSKKYWKNLYDNIDKWSLEVFSGCKILLGIGTSTSNMKDYYVSYQQALLALNVMNIRMKHISFSLYEDLGAYTILHHLDQSNAVNLFIKSQLDPLLTYTENKNIDLYHTLYVFLQNNGNIKSTSDELFIHRSSLLYRLEKIESLLNVDLNDAEIRFNLMMAFKLHDMHGERLKKS
ncbi:helix-turn-helix domain-containing protein [Metabacillus sp. B2-18]|uniref:helix-turn-helix domain-containing protein n=1 Tax=Metabacillus sp. B2-18 TaxID=2897333 RepID=UPI001E3F5233|nr:helix-turn-helix domain-containing protein [Metabacillus sp. B2-18]UGB31965.1 helix-turn-helix domain-containing protein [Metabacillus sp. B2-18]